MNHNELPHHCAICAYRQPAGLITIIGPASTRTEATCLTCATEALSYYATQRAYAAWFAATD